MKKITIKDIAKKAGVSRATVSRVLNNSGPVHNDTKKQILNIMQRLNYYPSVFARNLSRCESTTIGVLIPEIENPFFGEILKVISQEISERDLTMIIINSENDSMKDQKALQTLCRNQVKGLIYTPAVDYRTIDEQKLITNLLNNISAPVVLLDRRIDYLKNADGVFFNNYLGAYQATEKIIKAGHKKIAIINAGLERVLARERQEGYLDALKEYSIDFRKDYIFLGDYTIEKAYELSKKCLNLADRPTAVLTCNNFTSIGFLQAVKEAGLSMPEEITCIGFDRIKELELLDFRFNYIERNIPEMGKKAINFLFNRFAFPNSPYRQHIIAPKLVIYKI